MTGTVTIGDERGEDADAIAALVTRAFEGHPHSSGTEAAIVDALRAAGALTVSLVARDEMGEPIGHVAFSPVLVDGRPSGWHALAPLSVEPGRQGSGIGGALVEEGLARLRRLGSQGCVLIGDPAYYARFGFKGTARLVVGEPMQPFLQTLVLSGEEPAGALAFHPAFG